MAQTAVYMGIAPAVVGQVMTANDSHFSPIAYQADTDLVVGNFAFLKNGNPVRLVQAGTTALAGLIVRNQVYAHSGFGAVNKVPANQPVCPIIKGNVAVVNGTNTTVTVGMRVHASQVDGSCVFSNNATESSCTPTPWKVIKVYGTGAKNDMILIGTYDNAAPVTLAEADAAFLTKAEADDLYAPKTP